ncbi:MAG: hypothetical protein IMZ52_10205 [Actinobacteria bacterium]|nr:hypothetical protein [Actinomycetota bacterium]
MGWAIIPFLEGEEIPVWYNPKNVYCKQCNHRDCAEIRKLREQTCPICNKKFQGGDSFIEDKQYGTVHYHCLTEKLDL